MLIRLLHSLLSKTFNLLSSFVLLTVPFHPEIDNDRSVKLIYGLFPGVGKQIGWTNSAKRIMAITKYIFKKRIDDTYQSFLHFFVTVPKLSLYLRSHESILLPLEYLGDNQHIL